VSIKCVIELPQLPQRSERAHKGMFGRVLIIGGSRGMSGAVCLAGLGALRGGAGLVFLAVPHGIVPIVAAAELSYLTIPVPEDNHGRIGHGARKMLVDAVAKNDVVALGPGLGMSDDLIELVKFLYLSVEQPIVVDADGLNALASSSGGVDKRSGSFPCVLTPHPGEFARLLGTEIKTVQNNREQLTVDFAKNHNLVLVLKGHRTVISDGSRLAINTTGNSGMATGGSGDVLTGLIAALIGQGMQAFEAAQLGTHLHGLAGDLAAAEHSKSTMIASDLPKYLSRAWQQLQC